MKWNQLQVTVLLSTALLIGCSSVPSSSEVKEKQDVVRAQNEWCPQAGYDVQYAGSSWDDDSYCRRRRTDHCGGKGIIGGIASETWALLNVLCAQRWEGGYPDGPLHGWRGSWCGPCGDGSLDNTKAPCVPPRSY